MTPSSPARTALLAGGTGAIGSALLTQLLADERYDLVKVLSRRPLAQSHPRLQVLQLPDAGPATLGTALVADDVYCCLGTTLKDAGSRAAFERVDYHLVLELARAALAQGARQFLVVSSVGASARASSFYLRVKGRMEQAVLELGYPRTQIIRPSLLIAERPRLRPGEWLAQKVAPWLVDPLLRGPLARYRSAQVAEVATALRTLAFRAEVSGSVHHLPLEDFSQD